MPDAVVIGAGPNGLVAANVLVDHGWDVVVLEGQPEPGGAVRSAELIEPGFVNDVFSAFYPLSAASPVITKLALEDFGLTWRRAPLVLAHPAEDGTCPIVSTDEDDTAAALDELHPGDGDGWHRLSQRWAATSGPLLGALFTPFPPVVAGLRLVWGLPRHERLRFARFATLPVRRMAEEEFGGEAARRLLAGNALHSDLFPEQSLSGFFGWLLAMLGQDAGWPVPEGGAGCLATALVRRLEAKGGRVVCATPVTSVVIRGGRAVAVRTAAGDEVDAPRGVLADISAPRLFLDLVGADHLPAHVLEDIDRFQWDAGTVKVDWTLDGPIPWTAPPARRAGTVHVTESVDELTGVSGQLATGQVPARPFLLVGQQSMTDPTRQPPGKETAWAYTHVPRTVKGDAGGDGITGRWDKDDAERMADRVQARLEVLAPGFGALVRGRHVLTPPQLEEHDANLVGGAIGGGTNQLHQMLVFRPVPGLGRPETPVPGLFLASSSAHPGGGVHGACGSNAARAALAHDRLRRLVPVPLRRGARAAR